MGSCLMNHCKICLNKCMFRLPLPPTPCLPEVNPAGMSSQPLCCQLDQVTVIFVSDGSNSGHSFKLTFTAARKDSEGGDCADAVGNALPLPSDPLKTLTVLSVPGFLKNQVVDLGLLKVLYNPIC